MKQDMKVENIQNVNTLWTVIVWVRSHNFTDTEPECTTKTTEEEVNREEMDEHEEVEQRNKRQKETNRNNG